MWSAVLIYLLLIGRTANADGFNVSRDQLCASLKSCLSEFASVQALSSQTTGILAHLESDLPGEGDPDEGVSKRAVIDLKQRLSLCTETIFETCKNRLPQLEEELDKKLRFVTISGKYSFIEWDDVSRQEIRKLILRKMCSGSIAPDAFRKLNAVILYNSYSPDSNFFEKAGLPAPSDMDRRRIETFGGGGFFFQYLPADSKVDEPVSILGIAGHMALAGFKGEESSYSALDGALIHEFLHAKRRVDPEFKKKADHFLKFRFFDLQRRYSEFKETLDVKTRERHRALDSMGLNSSDWINRRLETQKWASDELSRFRAENGVPLQLFDDRLNPKLPGQKTGLQSADDYSMKNEEEYLAVAFSLYRYDRKYADKVYSKEELAWLASHWEYGYMTTRSSDAR